MGLLTFKNKTENKVLSVFSKFKDYSVFVQRWTLILLSQYVLKKTPFLMTLPLWVIITEYS